MSTFPKQIEKLKLQLTGARRRNSMLGKRLKQEKGCTSDALGIAAHQEDRAARLTEHLKKQHDRRRETEFALMRLKTVVNMVASDMISMSDESGARRGHLSTCLALELLSGKLRNVLQESIQLEEANEQNEQASIWIADK